MKVMMYDYTVSKNKMLECIYGSDDDGDSVHFNKMYQTLNSY